ncbi:hypothetical protein ACLOJK_030672 [Asimina triloba]
MEAHLRSCHGYFEERGAAADCRFGRIDLGISKLIAGGLSEVMDSWIARIVFVFHRNTKTPEKTKGGADAAMPDLETLSPAGMDLAAGDADCSLDFKICYERVLLSSGMEMECALLVGEKGELHGRRSFGRVRSSNLTVADGGFHGGSLGKMEHHNMVLR